MGLVASNRPFLDSPVGHHFEQTFHVPHRLARYHAGRRMDYATATPEVIASAIAAEIGRPAAYRPIDPQASAGSETRSLKCYEYGAIPRSGPRQRLLAWPARLSYLTHQAHLKIITMPGARSLA